MRLIPPAKTANVRAVWKQKLRSMCHPFLLIRIVLLKKNTFKNQVYFGKNTEYGRIKFSDS